MGRVSSSQFATNNLLELEIMMKSNSYNWPMVDQFEFGNLRTIRAPQRILVINRPLNLSQLLGTRTD